MKLRYVNGTSYIQLPKSLIHLLNIRRKDIFELILRRDTFDQGSDSKRQELSLVAVLIRGDPTQPLKRISHITITKFMDLMRYVPGQKVHLIFDKSNVNGLIKLTFDQPVVTYGIPDFHNLTEKDLRKRITKYKDREAKCQGAELDYDTLALADAQGKLSLIAPTPIQTKPEATAIPEINIDYIDDERILMETEQANKSIPFHTVLATARS